MSHKQEIAYKKELNYQKTRNDVLRNKTAHCTTVMVTEARLNDLKREFVCSKVPYGGDGKCFMFCRCVKHGKIHLDSGFSDGVLDWVYSDSRRY